MERSGNDFLKLIKDWVVPVVCAMVIAILINKFLFFKVEVPTGSMIPTVEIDDQIFVRRIYDKSKIERGDIVVFEKEGETELLLKRVIGLPGEIVKVENDGKVYINDEFLDEGYVKHPDSLTGTFVVPMDNYLMMGDNRADSEDARMWANPYIPAENIIAEAGLRVFPFNNMGFLK
ncbi:MAG: signal peptidase I [Sarcina sp.]